MFNKNPEVNDFTPSWLKLPANGSRPPLNWLQENSFPGHRNGSLNQKDDFNPPGAQRLPSVWNAPRPTAVPTAPAPARAPSNRMYKAVLPRNMTKRVLNRTAPPPQDVNKDSQTDDSINFSEAEERLLKEMGWDELQSEEPLTDEEITNFKHLNGGATLLHKKHQLADKANNNNNNNNNSIHGIQTQRSGLLSRRRLHGGPDLKKTLLATMGVSASCDDEDSDDDSDDNDAAD